MGGEVIGMKWSTEAEAWREMYMVQALRESKGR